MKKFIDVEFLQEFWDRIKNILLNSSYTELNTSNKTVIGAINEVRQTSAGFTHIESSDGSVNVVDNGDNSFNLTVVQPDPIDPTFTSNDSTIIITKSMTDDYTWDFATEQTVITSPNNTITVAPDSNKTQTFTIDVNLVPNEWVLSNVSNNWGSTVGTGESNTGGWIYGNMVMDCTAANGGVIGGAIMSRNSVDTGGIVVGHIQNNNTASNGGAVIGAMNTDNTAVDGGLIVGRNNTNNHIEHDGVVLGSNHHGLSTSWGQSITFVGSGAAMPVNQYVCRFVVGGGDDKNSINAMEVNSDGSIICRGDITFCANGSFYKLSDLLRTNQPKQWQSTTNPFDN